MRAEWRAREAETAPVKPAQLAVDEDLGGEGFPARFAGLLLPRPNDWLSWSIKSAQWFAPEAVLAAMEINATSVDYGIGLELKAARGTRVHDRTIVLTRREVNSDVHQETYWRRRPLLPGEDSNLQPTDYPFSEGFPPAWTISLPWRITAL